MPDHNAKTPEEIAKWDELLEEGYSVKAVGEIFGVHVQTIRKYLPGKGWTPAQARAHGTFMKHHNAKMRKLGLS